MMPGWRAANDVSVPSLLRLTFYLLPSRLFQDLLDSDWASVRKVLEQADILVIKYSVMDKLAFQQVRNGYAPRLRPLLRHWGVPVILVAVGARLNGEDQIRNSSVAFLSVFGDSFAACVVGLLSVWWQTQMCYWLVHPWSRQA